MYHTGTSGYGISRRSSGCTDYQTVTLDTGNVFAVDEEIDIGQIRRRSTIYHYLVQYQKIRWWFGRLALLAFAHYYAAQTTSEGQCGVTCNFNV